MKAEAMRAKSADELKDIVLELRKEQMTLRFQKSSQQLETTSKMRVVRRDIARAKTLMAEQARGTATPAAAKAAKATAAKAAKATAKETKTAKKPAAAKKAPKAKAEKA